MIPDPADVGLCPRLPVVRRAREYRLYDVSGRRYVDLWQVDGHAILGHRGVGVSTALKNLISRGLLGDLPSPAANRLVRALRELLPSHPFVRVYRSLDGCLGALSAWRGRAVGVADIADPIVPSNPAENVEISAWRPHAPAFASAARAVVPVLPFGICGGPWAACFREDPKDSVPPSEAVSAVALEGVTRGILGLRRHAVGAVASVLARTDTPSWEVTGIYLTPRFPRLVYGDVFDSFLREGVVISPRYDCPSILPSTLSDGEIAKTVGLLRSIPPQ